MRGLKKKALLFGMALSLWLPGCGSVDSMATTESFTTSDSALMNGEGIYSDYAASEEMDYDEEAGGTGSSSDSVRAGRKLIRTVDLEVETLEFEALLTYVQNKTNELGGYVENLNAYNGSDYYSYSYTGTGYRNDRHASLTLRIPKDRLDEFLTRVEESSNIINRSEKEKDVTLDYVDLDSHKAVLLAEQDRLLALMEQAETIEDIITLESRLSDIRYQIESMESKLRTYDNQIEYSTVYLSITEVVELTPIVTEEPTTWERISQGFVESLENIGNGFKEFFIGFIICLPYLVLLLGITLIILWIIFFSIKMAGKRKQKKAEKLRAQMPQGQPVQNNQPKQ